MSVHRAFPILLGSILLIGLAWPGAAQATPAYNPANGHWYQAVQVAANSIDWPTARAAAEARTYGGYRGHLVAITSEDEQQFVARNLPVQNQLYWWTGAYQDKTAPDYREPDGGWRWVTGEPWGGYTHWNPGRPDNASNVYDPDGENVLEFDARLGNMWNDFPAHVRIGGYLVEYEPGSGAGAVSLAQLLLIPNPVTGGQTAIGQVVLSPFAGVGGVVVSLNSSNPAAAVVPATLTVPAGISGMTFPITTFPVGATTPVVLTASGPGSPISATLQVQPSLTPDVNLLVNGSFELPGGDRFAVGSGVPAWHILKGTIDILTSSYFQSAPDGGSQSIDLLGSPGVATLEQSFPTVPGHDYLFSGYVSHNPSVSYGRAKVLLNGVFFVQLSHEIPNRNTDMQWQPFTHRFRATTATTTLTLSDVTGINDSQGTVLDGLSVKFAGQENPPVTPTAPAVPANLAAKAVSATQIDLTWTDNSNNETQFILYRKSGTGDFMRIGQVNAGITSYSDRGLSPSTTYTYLVRAWNPAGASRRSNEASATTLFAPPVAPTGLMAKAVSTTQINLDWIDNSDTPSAFVIYRKSGSGDYAKIATTGANSRSYTDRGLAPGTTYTYVVRAWNPGGASRRSNEASGTTPLSLPAAGG